MNRLSTYALALCASSLFVLSSCELTSTDTPPVVTVTPVETVTAAPGASLSYVMNVTSETDLTTAGFSIKYEGSVIFNKDTTFAANITSTTINVGFIVPTTMPDGAVLNLTFSASNSELTQVTRTVNITIPAGEINTYTAVIMSDIENADGSSFYSLEDNHLMKLSEAVATSAEVDLVYYFGATNKATLCAPSDSEVEAFTGKDGTSVIKKFSTRNATKLASVTTTTAQFDAISDDVAIKAATPTATYTAVKQLAKNNVLYAETVTGKKALIKVVDITGTSSNSYITIEVKVQK